MKTFKIFESPLGMREAVKVGWSWPAFLFTLIWLLVKKLYVIAFILWSLALIIIYVEIEAGTGDTISSIFSLIVGIVGGIQGNKWREDNLIERGYRSETALKAMTPEGALALFVQQKSNKS
tara:strand:+ start:3419 stop:3781 length:363 start_codon:yes stop_codon:yes gene_type:complete